MNHLVVSGLMFLTVVQQPPNSGINFFSLKQDVEIGAESAREAEQTLPLVRSAAINTYIQSLGLRLARFSPVLSLKYQFRVVNSKDVNSVTFPGGAVFVDRGLIELAQNEHELAAILAHEIAHAAARHGTSQLSRQLLAQAPASLALGMGTHDSWKDQLARLGISFGARATFLSYSPDQEIEANAIAVQILQKSGYSPRALPAILGRINKLDGAEKVPLPDYAYSHPQSADALKKLEAAIAARKAPAIPIRVTATFRTFHRSLLKVALPANPPASLAVSVLPREYVHPENYYKLNYPEGWEVTSTGPNGAIITPPDGLRTSRTGDDVTKGVMFDLFDISEHVFTLEQATERLIVSLRQRNQSLHAIPGAQGQMLMGAEPALRKVMIETSKVTNSTEIVWVVTRIYYQSLFYIVCVAPEEEFTREQQGKISDVFEQIIRSIQLK